MQNKNLPVPLMRDFVIAGNNIPAKNKTASIFSAIVFLAFMLVGFLLSFFTGKTLILLFMLIIGFIISFIAYVLLKKASSALPAGSLQDRILLAYSPLFAKLNMAGFESAVESAKCTVKLCTKLYSENPQIFTVVDESLRFYISRLTQIADGKKLIGEEKELKRHCERLESAVKKDLPNNNITKEQISVEISNIQIKLDRLETLNKLALNLTNELHTIRNNCENTLVEKIAGNAETERMQQLLNEQIIREKRIQAELEQLGL